MNGINIASWSKLSQVKLNSGETAYQYVVNKLLGQIPEALELNHDMPSIDEAKSVMLNRLSADVRKLEEAVHLLAELLSDDTKDNQDKDSPSISMKNLTSHLEEMKKLHQAVEFAKKMLLQKNQVQVATSSCQQLDGDSDNGDALCIRTRLGTHEKDWNISSNSICLKVSS